MRTNGTTRQQLRKTSSFQVLLLFELSTGQWLTSLKKKQEDTGDLTQRCQCSQHEPAAATVWLGNNMHNYFQSRLSTQGRLGRGREWEGTHRILPGSYSFPFWCSSNHEFSRRSLPAGSVTKVRPQSLLVLVWDVASPAKQQKKADAHQTPCPSTEISKALVWSIPCRDKNSLGWKTSYYIYDLYSYLKNQTS